MFKTNVLYIEGSHLVGKSYVVSQIQEELTRTHPEVRIECVFPEQFYTGVPRLALSKLHARDVHAYTHAELMALLKAHRDMLLHIDEGLKSGRADLIVVDGSFVALFMRTVLFSKAVYAVENTLFCDEFQAHEVARFVDAFIKPVLWAQKSLYVYLRFNLEDTVHHIVKAKARTLDRLAVKGGQGCTPRRVDLELGLMEDMHFRLSQPDKDGCMVIASSADVRGFFPRCIATDSDHVVRVVQDALR